MTIAARSWLRGVALLALAVLPACGTVYTRGRGDPFGAVPLQAVVQDVGWIVAAFDPPESRHRTESPGFVATQAFVSLPFDLVIDVALLPVDVVGWIFGYRKAG